MTGKAEQTATDGNGGEKTKIQEESIPKEEIDMKTEELAVSKEEMERHDESIPQVMSASNASGDWEHIAAPGNLL